MPSAKKSRIKLFPTMRSKSNSRKRPNTKTAVGANKRYSLLSSPSPVPPGNSTYLSSTPIPSRLSRSPPISYSPPQEYQQPAQSSPVPVTQKAKQNPRKKTKTRRVAIFHPSKSDKRPRKVVDKKQSEKYKKERVLIPKTRQKRKVNKFKSIRVEGGTVDLQVIQKMCGSEWSKTGDIKYTVETNTEQFKWGYLEVFGRGTKPSSLNKDWMNFHLLAGSVDVLLDSRLIDSLKSIGDSFLVPPNSTYEFRNHYDLTCKLTYTVIVLT